MIKSTKLPQEADIKKRGLNPCTVCMKTYRIVGACIVCQHPEFTVPRDGKLEKKRR